MKFYAYVTIMYGQNRALAEIVLTGESLEDPDGILSHVEVTLPWAAPGYESVPTWVHVNHVFDAEARPIPRWALKSSLQKLIPSSG